MEARLAMRGCAGVFMASDSRFGALGLLESEPSSLTFLLAMGEPEARDSALRLLGMFSLAGKPAI